MQRIIVDTDLGIDDALALLYLLGSEDARIEAITTVHGNVPVEVATANVFEILSIAGVSPACEIAQGAAKPLAGANAHATEVHGEDGLGGWTKNGRIAPGAISRRPASELICDIARRWPGETALLLIGPATNAALALRENPEAFRKLQRIIMMAGAVWEPGNVTATAEFNVYADPEAARAVVRCGIPVTMVGLDVTRKVSLTRELLECHLGRNETARAKFLRCIAEQGFAFYKQSSGWEGFHLHDPLAAAVVLDPSMIETRCLKLDVETRGELTRGMVVAERRPWKAGGETIDYGIDVDAARFLAEFCKRALTGCQQTP